MDEVDSHHGPERQILRRICVLVLRRMEFGLRFTAHSPLLK